MELEINNFLRKTLKDTQKKCCICGVKIKDYGHNPVPFGQSNKDKACTQCNNNIVIPVRINKIMQNGWN
jgi:hypothetical protein